MDFIHPNDNPADMLGNAASVVRFLADMTGELAGPAGGHAGLSNESANGLCLILTAVENTINRAASGL